MTAYLVALLAGYLIGSIPFAVLIARLGTGFDVTRDGTRNPGATNVFKNVGRIAGAAVGLLDYFKALVPCLAADWFFGLTPGQSTAAGMGAVLGHNFSMFLGFRGGKGGASTLGVLTYLDFPALLACGVPGFLSIPILGLRFLIGPVAISLFPILTAIHATARAAEWFPGWRQPGALPVAVSAALIALLWLRILPGVRRPAAPPAAP
jgi:glycerol-3-phosphate acyltransferase PlsY